MGSYRPREERKPTRLLARLNHDGTWSDALILNVSSRGLMAQCDEPPRRGEFIEFRRGGNIIVAQVRWSSDRRFGVLAQDAIDLTALSDDRHRRGPPNLDRRTTPRPPGKSLPTRADLAARAEASARLGRAIEFAFVAGAVVVAGALVADTAGSTLGAATQRARIAMAAQNGPQ